MSQFVARLSLFFKKRPVKMAIPFLVAVVAGSFGLKEFAKIRYDFSRVSPVYQEAKKLGVEMKKPSETTLEGEYEKLKDLDIDNWEQIRGPRPWEENGEEVE